MELPCAAPLRRFAARMLDLALFWLVVSLPGNLILEPDFPAALRVLNEAALNPLWGPGAFSLAMVPVEALLLATWGRTPGKWVSGLELAPAGAAPDHAPGTGPDADRTRGRGLDGTAALGRSWEVLVRGLALNLPLANLAALFLARRDLLNTGSTAWDRRRGLAVVHRPARGRWPLFCGLLAAFLAACATVIWNRLRFTF